MTRNSKKTVATLVAVALVSWGSLAVAHSAGGAGEGPAPAASSPLVTLNMTDGTVGEALRSIAKQAGWGVVMSAPESELGKPMTLILEKRPAREVVDIILTGSALQMSLKEGILHITTAAPLVPASVTPAPPDMSAPPRAPRLAVAQGLLQASKAQEAREDGWPRDRGGR
jgi:hypothetical protein